MNSTAQLQSVSARLNSVPLVGADALAVLREIINLTDQWPNTREDETTKRAEIRANADMAIAEIEARRDLFLTYLDRTFDERIRTFEKLFASLDVAFTQGPEMTAQVLTHITTLAVKSPFADLRDPVALRDKWDGEATWSA